jgi:hypothetical protein
MARCLDGVVIAHIALEAIRSSSSYSSGLTCSMRSADQLISWRRSRLDQIQAIVFGCGSWLVASAVDASIRHQRWIERRSQSRHDASVCALQEEDEGDVTGAKIRVGVSLSCALVLPQV